MPWPSCKFKTKKRSLPAGNSCPPPTRLYLLIYNYIRSLLHCSSKNTVTALLEYLDIDCSIRVPRNIDAIELGSPSQLQIILGGLTPIIFSQRLQPSLPPLIYMGDISIDYNCYFVMLCTLLQVLHCHLLQ